MREQPREPWSLTLSTAQNDRFQDRVRDAIQVVSRSLAGKLLLPADTTSQVDPTSGTSSTLVSSLYENLFLISFLALDGHHWLLRSLQSSFTFAPVGRIALSPQMAPTAIAMFGEMFRAGIVFAAPVMVFLTIVSAMIGLLARAVPALNVLEIGFTLRVIVALVAMFVFAPLTGPALDSLHQDFLRWLERGLTAL